MSRVPTMPASSMMTSVFESGACRLPAASSCRKRAIAMASTPVERANSSAATQDGARPSRPIHSDRRVKVLEFDTCVGGCKLPVGLGEVGIAVVLPSGDFLDEGLLVGNPAVEALGRQDAEFRLCQNKPAAMLWSVVPFEALDQPPGFAGRKGFIK